jgi:diguanylate cyclase (GGDEF)-like protein
MTMRVHWNMSGNWLTRAMRRFGTPAAPLPLRASVDRTLQAGLTVTLVYLNIERFRSVVRTRGPEAADEVLRKLDDRLRAAFGGAAVLRLPGDEFVLMIMAGAGDPELTLALREARRQIGTPFAVAGGNVTLAAAIGVASAPRDGNSFAQLYHQAESAMLDARAAGGTALGDATELPKQCGQADALMAFELRAALDRGEFVLHYQPQIDLGSNDVIGAEALVRWRHPTRGLLQPSQFIEAAERTGMIVPIGRWVLQEACRQAAQWRSSGHRALTMAVNLSARQFECGALEEIVHEALQDAALPAACLELELTETILIHDVENVLRQIRQLKAMGLTLSLDDFGTGYSSLSYLKKFAVDKIKIDRSFVSGLADDANDAAIVRAIVQIARSLGLRTVAEGVEDERALACLRLLGCDVVQGYYYSPPLTATAFGTLLTVLGRHAG